MAGLRVREGAMSASQEADCVPISGWLKLFLETVAV
jgi:hypothetical protein